jgi:hypothetical protein
VTTAVRFALWLEVPGNWAALEAIVAEYRAAGHRKWAAKAAAEVLRWRTGKSFPNAFTPYMAREWMRRHPEVPRFFDTAPSMADAAPSRQMEMGW